MSKKIPEFIFPWGKIEVFRFGNGCSVYFKVEKPAEVEEETLIVMVWDDGTVEIQREKLMRQVIYRHEPIKEEEE